MYIDIFAGCGGLSYGLHKADIPGLFAVEKNESAFETLKYNLIDNANHFQWPIWLPIKNHDINDLMAEYEKELIGLQGSVDLVVGGPPCQGFSLAGSRNKDDLRNQLSSSYIKFIKLVKPKNILFENVGGFTISFDKDNENHQPYSKLLINELTGLGYDVHAQIINMSEFGVPQKRKRFILFGTKNGKGKVFFEELYQNKDTFLKSKGLKTPITIWDAIGDLEHKHGVVESVDTKGYKNGLYGRARTPYIKMMRNGLPKNSIPDSHRFVKHNDTTISLFKELMALSDRVLRITPHNNHGVEIRKRSIITLKKNEVCNTLTSIPDDMIHYSEPRVMTVREYARIQSFPDIFKFKGKYTTGGVGRKTEVPRYTQVANAVPPLFGEYLGVTVRKFLAEKLDL